MIVKKVKKKIVVLLLIASFLALACAASANFKISVNEKNFESCSEAACQEILDLFRKLEKISAENENINISIKVTHGAEWSMSQGFEALKSYGSAGIDSLIQYGLEGLNYLKSYDEEGWKYLVSCGEKGLQFLSLCGQAGLEYLLGHGDEAWKYLLQCGDAGVEFLKSLGDAGLYYLRNHSESWSYFSQLGEKGLELLRPHAEEGLKYIIEGGSQGWEYIKSCGAAGFEFIKSLGQAGLDYVLSFGKAGLDYLLSFGAEGRDFLSKFNYDVTELLKDIPVEIPELPKEYKPDNIIKTIFPHAENVNINTGEIKRFIEADALEWIDVVSDFKDKDYFNEGALNFCREYTNSSSSYGFANKEDLINKIKTFYGGGFACDTNRKFSFNLSSSTVLWNNTIRSAGEESFFSLKNLQPGKSGDMISLALRLLQTLKDKNIDNNSAVRLFFRTNYDWLQVVAVIRENADPTYYLAGNRPLLEKNSLVKTLMDNNIITLDSSMERLIFNLLKSDNRLKFGTNIDTCLDVFINQVFESLDAIAIERK
ncbi:MAG: hypothetical protein IJ859_08590 [Synergistaceae bacterium]|nr:hypothetical protein [Synergistaceae bacterium]